MTTNDRIMAGIGNDREAGIVDSIDGDMVTIRWESGCVTTQPIEALEDVAIL